MKISSHPTWKAYFSIGLKKDSSTRMFSESEFLDILNLALVQQYDQGIKPMPVRVTSDTLVGVDFQFPQCTLHFTNEPSLKLTKMERENTIKDLAIRLLEMMNQTRTLIVFPESTLFVSEEIREPLLT